MIYKGFAFLEALFKQTQLFYLSMSNDIVL